MSTTSNYIELTPESCKSDNFRAGAYQPAGLHFNRNGSVTLNTAAERTLKLNEGDRLLFLQNRNDPRDFLLVNTGPAGAGFPVKRWKKSRLLCFTNAALAAKVRTAHHGESFRGNFKALMAGKPTKRDGREGFELLSRAIV